MPLYALDGPRAVFAGDAASGRTYRCFECSSPLKVRKGGRRQPHFYHLKRSPSCRLYSKSEDHLILQLQLQKTLSLAKDAIEQPFLSIHRIADLLWEEEQIVFEIQCSTIEPEEVLKRRIDYKKAGYDLVWLLDDRIFNRRFVRPAEKVLRTQTCYYFSFNRLEMSVFYDQLEIFIAEKRVKKGFPLVVELPKPRAKPNRSWPNELPVHLATRIEIADRFFSGDLIYRAIQASNSPGITSHFARWKMMEIDLTRKKSLREYLVIYLRRLLKAYERLIDYLIERTNQ